MAAEQPQAMQAYSPARREIMTLKALASKKVLSVELTDHRALQKYTPRISRIT
jgi:hypothetical protein